TLPRCGKPRAYSIGRRMSGFDSCALVAPSVNSTIECTIDCGCTTTSMRSKPTPNSSLASITSRPLFISVDESTVIFGPIDHVGWASASSTVAVDSRSAGPSRNGPPLAGARAGGPPPEGPAARGQHEPVHFAQIAGPEALVDGAVLRVDGDELG